MIVGKRAWRSSTEYQVGWGGEALSYKDDGCLEAIAGRSEMDGCHESIRDGSGVRTDLTPDISQGLCWTTWVPYYVCKGPGYGQYK